MMKNMICLIVILGMLVLMLPGTAVKSAATMLSVEDILNDYHAKAFEQNREPTEGKAADNTRSGERTLEQETVETLRSAGYEAYNVTGDNYDELENSLQTDLASVGVDREGSYIVVISGAEENSGNPNSRAGGNFIEEDDGGLGGDDNVSFEYRYGELTYTMRYLTITAADNYRYSEMDKLDMLDDETDAEIIENVLNTAISLVLDLASPIINPILDILGIEFVQIDTHMQTSMTFFAGVNWTREYTQVYYENTDTWITGSSVDYVRIWQEVHAVYYDKTVNGYVSKKSDARVSFKYSEHYYDYAWRNNRAARGYTNGSYYHEFVGNVLVYLNEDKSPVFRFIQYQGTLI